MRSKSLLVLLVAAVAVVVAYVAGSAIGSSGRLAGPPVTYNSAGDPVIKSRNGQFSITVGSAGIQLRAPNGVLVLNNTDLNVLVPNLVLRSNGNVALEGNGQGVFKAGATVSLVAGQNVMLNGCAQPVVRGTDSVTGTGNTGKITPGQTAVCMG
jgi:hypothetical protein